MSIKTNLQAFKNLLPEHVKLVVVSKTQSPEAIMQAYNAGQRIFGESRAQEITPKYDMLPKDIEWHMIGHLQTNKVKYIASFIALIHSVDSLKLLKEINKHAVKNNRIIPCLLQIHIATESSKFGLTFEESCQLLDSDSYKQMENIVIHGLMGMASFTDNTQQVHKEFSELKNYFGLIKQRYFAQQSYFKELSMGMSDDYRIGIEHGSTMVRVGSAIFGTR